MKWKSFGLIRETFPGKMLNPSSENVLLPEKIIDLIVNFYTDTYVTYEFRKPADELIHNESIWKVQNQI